MTVQTSHSSCVHLLFQDGHFEDSQPFDPIRIVDAVLFLSAIHHPYGWCVGWQPGSIKPMAVPCLLHGVALSVNDLHLPHLHLHLQHHPVGVGHVVIDGVLDGFADVPGHVHAFAKHAVFRLLEAACPDGLADLCGCAVVHHVCLVLHGLHASR